MSPTKKNPEWWDLQVPRIFPQTYLDIARERGTEPDAILKQAHLPANLLAPQHSEITVIQMKTLVDTIVATVGNAGIGIDVGMRLPPTAYGNFGYALLCSETMADVIKLCQRFWHLVGRGVNLSVQEHGDTCVIDISPYAAIPENFKNLMHEATLTSFYRGFQLLLGQELDDVEFWFDFAAPKHADKVLAALKRVHYDMPAVQFRFPTTLLKAPLGMHNPTGLQFAIEQCEREESLLDIGVDQLLTKVKSEMVFNTRGYPSLEVLSQKLNMTARTLRRKLDQQGANYKVLLEEAKRRDAIRLLDDRDMTVQKVAELLGYNDPANFTRAFRQWTGQTPSQYRLTRTS